MTTISPPISPQPVETRPRAGTAMSSNSTRSRRSNSSASKLNSNETSGEKKRLNTKADPTQAITEATPGQYAPVDCADLPTDFPMQSSKHKRSRRSRICVRWCTRTKRAISSVSDPCGFLFGLSMVTSAQRTLIVPTRPGTVWSGLLILSGHFRRRRRAQAHVGLLTVADQVWHHPCEKLQWY